MKLGKKWLTYTPWIFVLTALVWLAFFHKDEFGMTSWEHTRDAFGKDDWIGWIHPFGMEVSRAVLIGPFDSVEQCQNDAFDRLQNTYDEWQSVQYYCGYRCTSDDHRLREESCRVVRK